MLTSAKIKSKLEEYSKDELIELLYETVNAIKDAQTYVLVKLEGEPAILEILDKSKKQIYKEFYPTRGLPKLRVVKVEEILLEMKKIGNGTIWPIELLVYFCEVAAQFISKEGDIFEDMGDCFTDTYEEVVQMLNKEKTAELYERYNDRLKVIANTSGCECWGIHDVLSCSYSDLIGVDHDEQNDDADNSHGVISYAAMSMWLKIPEDVRQKYIRNVWCGKCVSTTTIQDLSVQWDMHGIILQGDCSNCGHQVARFIER